MATIPHQSATSIRFRSCTVLLTLMAAAACAPSASGPAGEADAIAATAFEAATPTATDLPLAVLPDGFEVRLELAVTPQEVAEGLMYRVSLPEDRGMLFLFERQRYPSFYMKNTLIPLDIIFLTATGSVVDVVENAPPCAADPCPTYSPRDPVLAVLELAAGTARSHGIERGAVITFDRIPGYPRDNEESEVRN